MAMKIYDWIMLISGRIALFCMKVGFLMGACRSSQIFPSRSNSGRYPDFNFNGQERSVGIEHWHKYYKDL